MSRWEWSRLRTGSVGRGALGLVLALVVGLPLSAADRTTTGPLAEYVAKKDDTFQWKKRREGTVATTAYAELRMTSQTWRDIPWKHQLFVLRPSTVPADARTGVLFIAGGSWRKELDDETMDVKLPREAPILAMLAEQLRAPVAILLHVPQQPIFDGKSEDAIIAYTFEEYMKSRDPEWPLLLPMVKSAVRGMDAVQEFAKQQWDLNIESFTITGGSKRGWTTWLTGAVDKRAVAIAPMVIDVLNMGRQMEHQRATWGTPSRMIEDYTRRGLDRAFDTAAGRELMSIVDPFSYRAMLTQPKLIILGTNDPYWPLDALNLYWPELSGQKHVLYVPNNGHGLNDVTRLVGSLAALHQQVATGKPLPKLDWKFANGGEKLTLRVTADRKAERAEAWIATSMTKDFRESKWTSTRAEQDGDAWICRLDVPKSGYAALFGEMVFAGAHDVPFFLSTNVQIVSGGK